MKRIVHFFVLLGLFWAPAAPSAWGRAAGPTFSGTFLQLWNAHAGWSGQQWQDLLASMRAIGLLTALRRSTTTRSASAPCGQPWKRCCARRTTNICG